jgi:hypothetical protein
MLLTKSECSDRVNIMTTTSKFIDIYDILHFVSAMQNIPGSLVVSYSYGAGTPPGNLNVTNELHYSVHLANKDADIGYIGATLYTTHLDMYIESIKLDKQYWIRYDFTEYHGNFHSDREVIENGIVWALQCVNGEENPLTNQYILVDSGTLVK